MKNKHIILLTLVLITIAVLLVIIYWKSDRTKLEFIKEGEVIFKYGDIDTSQCLSDEELSFVKNILHDKKMYKDNYTCGFSEDISVRLNNSQTFCFARDTCPIVYWKEKDRFIKLKEEEWQKLYELLEKYGFFFPCI